CVVELPTADVEGYIERIDGAHELKRTTVESGPVDAKPAVANPVHLAVDEVQGEASGEESVCEGRQNLLNTASIHVRARHLSWCLVRVGPVHLASQNARTWRG